MTNGIKLILTEDNTLKTYNDEYDIVIHCESQTEQNEVLAKLNREQEPTGGWIKHEHGYWSFINEKGERDGWQPEYECSKCGSNGWKYPEILNYCPNCGEKKKSVNTRVADSLKDWWEDKK